MSRGKTVHVNRDKIMEELESSGMKQKALAKAIDMDYLGVWRSIHNEEMSEDMLDRICRVLDVAPEYIRDLTGGLDWLMGEKTRCSYAFHLYQGASLYRGTKEILETVQINTEKLSKKQMDFALSKFYELACLIRSEIEKDVSKKSSV